MDKLDLILEKLESMDTRLDSMDTRLDSLEQFNQVFQVKLDALDELKQVVYALRHGQEETNAKLDGLTLDVARVQVDVVTLKESQDRQNKILESLALRSLEQETDLRELKRVK